MIRVRGVVLGFGNLLAASDTVLLDVSVVLRLDDELVGGEFEHRSVLRIDHPRVERLDGAVRREEGTAGSERETGEQEGRTYWRAMVERVYQTTKWFRA